MVIAYAGRLAKGDEFPPGNVEFVRTQIARLITGLRPRAVVGSAAAGADLLVLEAALAAGADAHVKLAGDRAAFLESSVTSVGEQWGQRFHGLLAEARVSVEEVPRIPGDSDASYRAVTELIATAAAALCQSDEELVVLAISRRTAAGASHTDALVRLLGPHHLALHVDPSRDAAATETAFVAMPFGVKPWPERDWEAFDADESYHRVILPALLDAGYAPTRADTDALVEVIDHTMLRQISAAPVMVADLASSNANVFWELGVRHAWRRSGTVLVGTTDQKPPFDVARVPIQRYDRSEAGLTDAQAVAGIRTLSAALAKLRDRRPDSPVFAAISQLRDAQIPAATADDDETASELLAEISVAADLRQPEQLLELDRRVAASSLRPTAQATLSEQIGVALIGLSRYEDALRMLTPLATADRTLTRHTLQEQYAHALIRSVCESDEHDDRLRQAELILRALVGRHGSSGERYGLLGSVAKRRVHRALEKGAPVDEGEVAKAIDAYERGMCGDPGDYYPGINTVALLRLSWAHWDGGEQARQRALQLLPVVRFAIERKPRDHDAWALLTLAECSLHAHLLDGADTAAFASARLEYAAAAAVSTPQQRASAATQLELMARAGDPASVLDPLLELLR